MGAMLSQKNKELNTLLLHGHTIRFHDEQAANISFCRSLNLYFLFLLPKTNKG